MEREEQSESVSVIDIGTGRAGAWVSAGRDTA
jgi:hypothetical protein